MKILRLILGDQLTSRISALEDVDREHDVVLLVEVHAEATYVRHHKQKIVLVLSAMRHFAEKLREAGIQVDYVRLDDPGNTGSFTGEVERALGRYEVDRIVVTEPGEWRVQAMVETWRDRFGLPIEIRDDDRFFCSRAEFAAWAADRKTLQLEYFYRHMRRKTGWLMDGGEPAGGQWNYDAQNREALQPDIDIPFARRFTPDAITGALLRIVGERYSDHFGDLESFGWGVTRTEALVALQDFITQRLPMFGAYQDAMKAGEAVLFHSLLSPYLNLGLLSPQEVCEAALKAYAQEAAPLSAVEGFIRQILGWREYLRGIYWLKMPDYTETNYLAADRPLPSFYWTAETDLACLHETIVATRRNAYAHHIQRLMVTGNFALLAGISPAEVEAWYLSVYADAFEWVELPNTHGMALYADGGLLSSKPYAASGAYIDRMSDYCQSCRYSPQIKLGHGACPFNILYWRFLIVNKQRLASNPRMALMYGTLQRMDAERRLRIVDEAEAFLDRLDT